MTKVIDGNKLESLLLSNWTSFMDRTALMRKVLEDVRDTNYNVIRQKKDFSPMTRLTLTKMSPTSKNHFELWVEFIAPKGGGQVVGTHTYVLDWEGVLELKEAHGVQFLTETKEAGN